MNSASYSSVPEVDDQGREIQRPVARRLFDIPAPEPNSNEELLKSRFLCRGGGMLLVGQTGTGKSTLALQMSIYWGAGLPCFGFVPARPLKSLLIQAENDEGDLAEMRDGVMGAIEMPGEQLELSCSNTLVFTESARTSVAFLKEVLEPLIADQRPDIVWLDPALAFLGGDSSSQQDVGSFLRNGINPLLQSYGCACVIVHHTNKPGAEKAVLMGSDTAYLGSGSAEWANWPRAVVALRKTETQGLFTLNLGKRGARLGWKNEDGSCSFDRHIRHADGTITWVEVKPDEVPVKKSGRAVAFDVHTILKHCVEGDSTTEWQKRCHSETGMSKSTFHKLRAEAENVGAALKVGNKWTIDTHWKANRTRFAPPRAALGAEIQNSPISVQTEPSSGSSKSAPKGAGLDWTNP